MGDSYRPGRSPPRYRDYDYPDEAHVSRDRRRNQYSGRGDGWRRRSRSPRDSRMNEHYYDDNYTARPRTPPEDGTKDMAKDDDKIKIVLVRNLKESVTEAMLAKGLEKLYRGYEGSEDGATSGSLRRVLLVRDRGTDKSINYGFAEYHKLDDAVAAVNKAIEKTLTIASELVTICFAHNGIFPHASFGRPERNPKFILRMPNTQFEHKYWNEQYYASELMVNEKSPHDEVTVPKDTESASKKPATKKKKPAATLDGKPQKKKDPSVPVAAVNSQLQYWQKKTAETRNDVQTFAHEETLVCYLCATKLTSVEMLHRHIKESELHSKKSKDDAAIKAGHQLMKQRGIDPQQTINADIQTSKPAPVRRDRAAERRQAETAQVATSQPAEFSSISLKGLSQKKQAGIASGSSSDNDKPSYGKGMSMMQKAGYVEGQGLGSGSGITAPIDQSLYATGVGLGHEGGKIGDAVEEAGRKTRDDRTEYSDKAKETAKRRYEMLG